MLHDWINPDILLTSVDVLSRTFGVITVQTFKYFIKFPNDQKRVKFVVGSPDQTTNLAVACY